MSLSADERSRHDPRENFHFPFSILDIGYWILDLPFLIFHSPRVQGIIGLDMSQRQVLIEQVWVGFGVWGLGFGVWDLGGNDL